MDVSAGFLTKQVMYKPLNFILIYCFSFLITKSLIAEAPPPQKDRGDDLTEDFRTDFFEHLDQQAPGIWQRLSENLNQFGQYALESIFNLVLEKISYENLNFKKPHALYCGQTHFEFQEIFTQLAKDPEQDPLNYKTEKEKKHCLQTSNAYFPQADISNSTHQEFFKSNNNVAIHYYEGRLFIAIRTAPIHYPTPVTELRIYSTQDGEDWTHEYTIDNYNTSLDFREPFFIEDKGLLYFYYMALDGRTPETFLPQATYYMTRNAKGLWTHADRNRPILGKNMVPWNIVKRGGYFWMSAYQTNGFTFDSLSDLAGSQERSRNYLFRSKTPEGFALQQFNPEALIYSGGVSEMAFEIDQQENFWLLGRNDLGDQRGYGTVVGRTPLKTVYQTAAHAFKPKANPKLISSPRMFEHNGEMYVIGRRTLNLIPYGDISFLTDPGTIKKVLDKIDPEQKYKGVVTFLYIWLRNFISPQTTALYRINRNTQDIEFIVDLPGAGDTAFASIVRLGRNKFLIANYTSPLNQHHISWEKGKRGSTQIYLQTIEFKEINQH